MHDIRYIYDRLSGAKACVYKNIAQRVLAVLGICNGYLLTKRVTPFNAQDLKVLSDALELTGNYFNTFELIMIIIGVTALIVWVFRCGNGADSTQERCTAGSRLAELSLPLSAVWR